MRISKSVLLSVLAILVLLVATVGAASAAGLTGAIYTTDAGCTGVNVNLFVDKDAVYLDGGPAGSGSGLPDGYYFVKITEPSGTLLGTSGANAPVQVTNGKFVTCYQLSAILLKASDGTPGYDTTSNTGGEYKVWVSPTADFAQAKTDNFKVKAGVTPARLQVLKFYDANANGLNDDGQLITGWKVRIYDGMDWIRYTPADLLLDPDTYTVDEFAPVETNWRPTTATSFQVTLPPDATVEFGNLCLGPGGGLTLGFWSNKNGQALITDDPDLLMLRGLNLRNASGANFDPTTYAALRTWLLNGTATNMAYMLSVQLAAMQLNVLNSKVDPAALIYAPGTTSANALGYATVGDVMAEANAELGAHGVVVAGSPYRSYQEALKNALDWANNNQTFVQPKPCPFSFN